MSEAAVTARQQKIHYRGRGGQIIIYLGKLLRGFVYQSDWIVLPMSALIAGIVSMVVKRDFFVTMEGSLKGAFALTCVSIWNGCFNSIQVVCREREIIKREHRSGLHISAYIFSHMVYQGLLCLAQTGITLYVCKQTGMLFPKQGLFTKWLIADIGITVFLITYASDMLSLWISCMTRNTTTAMTVMPFILIFQLVFSGGIFTLPEWAIKLSSISISNDGLKCIAAQSNYNELPLVTAWNAIVKTEKQEINATITLGQVMDFLQRDDVDALHNFREKTIKIQDIQQSLLLLLGESAGAPIAPGLPSINDLVPMAEAAAAEKQTNGAPESEKSNTVNIGQIIDEIAASDDVQANRDASYTINTTVGTIVNLIGRQKLQQDVQELTRRANQNAFYKNTKETISGYWVNIGLFIIAYSVLAVVFLEFVDKDKR